MPTQDELRQLLTDLIDERKKANPAETLNQFGQALGRLVASDHPGFSKQHLTMWKRGTHISDEAARALVAMAAVVYDGASQLQAKTRPATILAFEPLPEGTMYAGAARYCLDPACGKPYIPTNYFQRYCPLCRATRQQNKRSH